jgi:hypothetical protein
MVGLFRLTAGSSLLSEIGEAVLGKDKYWSTLANGMIIICFIELAVWGMGYLAR